MGIFASDPLVRVWRHLILWWRVPLSQGPWSVKVRSILVPLHLLTSKTKTPILVHQKTALTTQSCVVGWYQENVSNDNYIIWIGNWCKCFSLCRNFIYYMCKGHVWRDSEYPPSILVAFVCIRLCILIKLQSNQTYIKTLAVHLHTHMFVLVFSNTHFDPCLAQVSLVCSPAPSMTSSPQSPGHLFHDVRFQLRHAQVQKDLIPFGGHPKFASIQSNKFEPFIKTNVDRINSHILNRWRLNTTHAGKKTHVKCSIHKAKKKQLP